MTIKRFRIEEEEDINNKRTPRKSIQREQGCRINSISDFETYPVNDDSEDEEEEEFSSNSIRISDIKKRIRQAILDKRLVVIATKAIAKGIWDGENDSDEDLEFVRIKPSKINNLITYAVSQSMLIHLGRLVGIVTVSRTTDHEFHSYQLLSKSLHVEMRIHRKKTTFLTIRRLNIAD